MLLAAARPVISEFKVDASKRQVTGYASTFNNVDLGGDRVLPGAFRKSLADDLPAGRIRVKRDHKVLIGKALHAEEDSKGLLTLSQISKTATGDETLTLIEDGVITSMSFEYVAHGKKTVNEGGQRIRNLSQLEVREWGFVEEPMNPMASIVAVKSLDDVGLVLDQMSSALYHLRSLSRVPPEIAVRLRAMLEELGPLASSYPVLSDPSQVAELTNLLGSFQSLLAPRT